MKDLLILLSALCLLTACESGSGREENQTTEIGESGTNVTKTIPVEETDKIIASIPSANSITATIKASGAPFSTLVLNNPMNIDKYSTSFRKEINLGIYGTDLGYIGVYQRDDLITDHLKVIYDLAHDLDLGQFINEKRIKSISDNGLLSDSIISLTGDVFRQMDVYLRENDRYNASILIMAGCWLEAMHIATSVAYNSKIPNETLKEKIAEQKIVLEKFILLLNNFEDQNFFAKLNHDLLELKLIYNGIEVNEDEIARAKLDTTKAPVGLVEISDTQLAQIAVKINDIRKEIIEPA